jgi:hypothetical protein
MTSVQDRLAARRPNNPWVVVIGTVVMIAIGLALMASIINIWPSVEASATTSTAGNTASEHATRTVRLLFGTVSVKVSPSTALILLVMIVGALGSLIQAATSFADFIGNRRFYSSWVVWYLLRLIVGMLLALLLYFAFRGGLFSGDAPPTSVNPYGVAALAGLAGLFSKQATDKLREVFETMFRVSEKAGDSQREDDLIKTTPAAKSAPAASTVNPAPEVSTIQPNQVPVGSGPIALHVFGENFVNGSSVVVDGSDYHTTFVSAQQLDADLPGELFAREASLQVTVHTAPPGGGESHPPKVLEVLIDPAVSSTTT